MEIFRQTNVENEQRHCNAEHAIRQGSKPGFRKQAFPHRL